MMAWTHTKWAATVIAGVALLGGTGGFIAVKTAMADEKGAAPAAQAAAQDAPVTPESDKPAEDADANRISVRMAPPVVVTTVPQSGKTDVIAASVKELKVTFSKPMQDGSWSWSTWGEENFPKTTGKPRYLADKRTCVLPVELQPGKTYAIWLNSNNFGNFKDSNGQKAVPYLLIFETKK